MSTNSIDGPKMKKTLGLTGLTMNAMALIAPGAFLWLTFAQQCQYGAPMAAQDMWFGIVAALALCFATAISYAELSKLYPGAGSSYFFAEQAFLSKTHAYKFARLAKFVIGWASHLYYWVYPGVMVGVTAILVGYIAGQVMPDTFNGTINSPTLMIVFCILFAFGVSYIAHRGVTGSTGVNVAINVIQISALLVFSVVAIGYRMSHDKGSTDVPAVALVDGAPATETPKYVMEPKLDKDGKPVKDKKGEPVMVQKKDEKGEPIPEKKDGTAVTEAVAINFDPKNAVTDDAVDKNTPEGDTQPTHHYFPTAASVVKPHGLFTIVVQACIAILILVGFESVTSMGEEAKNAKRDIPRAVLLSLFIQGVVCYLIEYFAANYFLNPAYSATDAASSSAPVGDMTLIIGGWLFGSASAAKVCMLLLAFTVFLALIGTTLSCINTGARVTYAMGRDDEVPSHFGMLHGKNLTPHRAIWTLAFVSTVIGIIAVLCYLCGPAVTDPEGFDKAVADVTAKNSIWYPSFLLFSAKTAAAIPNSLLVVTLTSNFGTFMLYMLTCVIAIVAFREHHSFNGFKHMVVPVFGLVANLVCMLFYLIGPLGLVDGMSWKESYLALAVAAVWGIYGWWYFRSSSKAKGRSTLVTKPVENAVPSGVLS